VRWVAVRAVADDKVACSPGRFDSGLSRLHCCSLIRQQASHCCRVMCAGQSGRGRWLRASMSMRAACGTAPPTAAATASRRPSGSRRRRACREDGLCACATLPAALSSAPLPARRAGLQVHPYSPIQMLRTVLAGVHNQYHPRMRSGTCLRFLQACSPRASFCWALCWVHTMVMSRASFVLPCRGNRDGGSLF
jgi:hypothetical protein